MSNSNKKNSSEKEQEDYFNKKYIAVLTVFIFLLAGALFFIYEVGSFQQDDEEDIGGDESDNIEEENIEGGDEGFGEEDEREEENEQPLENDEENEDDKNKPSIMHGENKTPKDVLLRESIYKYFDLEGNNQSVEFHYSFEELEKLDVEMELNKNILNETDEIRFVIGGYEGMDNSLVARPATKMMSVLRWFYGFDIRDLRDHQELTCSDSTPQNRVFVFDPYSDRTGVFVDEDTGCVQIEAENILDFVALGDKVNKNLLKDKFVGVRE